MKWRYKTQCAARIHQAGTTDAERLHRKIQSRLPLFQSLGEVREQTEQWLKEYSEERPHESLDHLTPREYLLTKIRKTLVTHGCNCGTVTHRHGPFLRDVAKRQVEPVCLAAS